MRLRRFALPCRSESAIYRNGRRRLDFAVHYSAFSFDFPEILGDKYWFRLRYTLHPLHCSTMKTVIACTIAAFLSAAMIHAQAPGVPIENNGSLLQNGPMLEKAKVLREGGKLPLTIAKVKEQLATPVPAPVALVPASAKPLSGREVAERARA